MGEAERRRKDDVKNRLDKLASDIVLLKERITSDVEYTKAMLRGDISQLKTDVLYLKTNQHKIEEQITTLENLMNNLTREIRQKW